MSPSGTGNLAGFQNAFARALVAAGDAPAQAVAGLVAQPGFAVYRNTVIKGCMDALQANYPAVVRLVGEEWFRATAAVYVRKSLPRLPMLAEYGADFADFLERFPPATELASYLPGVARLDQLWTEAHVAADASVMDPATLQMLAPEQLEHLRLRPHPAARWAWFEDAPVYTIWSRNRTAADPHAEIEWQPEGALLTRPDGPVIWTRLDTAGCAFLNACAAGCGVAEATAAALDHDGHTDLSALMCTLLVQGAFCAAST